MHSYDPVTSPEKVAAIAHSAQSPNPDHSSSPISTASQRIMPHPVSLPFHTDILTRAFRLAPVTTNIALVEEAPTINPGAKPVPKPPPTINAGTRFAFAPYPVPIEGLLYRVYVVFENTHGDLFCAGTDLMAPSLEAADTICDTLNVHVDLNRDQWKCLASAAFCAVETAKEQAASEAKTAASERTVAPCDPDEPW